MRRSNRTEPERKRGACGRAAFLLLAVAAWAGLPTRVFAAEPSAPDAVIELWEQHWTLQPDGALVYHEKQHVRLNHERAYGEFADPRITYNADTDKLEVLAARTKLPDGRYRDLPGYAAVDNAPDSAAGWPAFAAIRQKQLVMSGLEPGCVVELEYRITSKPGTRPLAGDVRLDHRYAVKQRNVTIDSPADAPVKVVFANLPVAAPEPGTTQLALRDLPPAAEEPQAPPWQTRSPRLTFARETPGWVWLDQRTRRLGQAAAPSDELRKVAQEWTKGCTDGRERLRALQQKLADTFTVVDFDAAWRPSAFRPATELLACGYGLPAEAAALLLALAQTVDAEVCPAAMAWEHSWAPDAAQESMIAADVLVFEEGNDFEVWHPHQGRISGTGRWVGAALLVPDGEEVLPLPLVDMFGLSRCELSGRVQIKEDGTLGGDVLVRTTGTFVNPDGLRTADAQKSRIAALLGRVLPDAQVESFAVTTLAPEEFTATAKLKSGKPLKKLDGRWHLALAQDGPLLGDVSLPLAAATRRTNLWLPGPMVERVTLVLEWPEKWTPEVRPSSCTARNVGVYGSVDQDASPAEHGLTLRRVVELKPRERMLPPDAWAQLQPLLNTLRSEAARTLILKP